MQTQTLKSARGQRGFTLIELMIVVVIVGILASVAYNSWRNSVLRANRSEGHSFLADAAARQERFFSNCSSYTNVIVGAAGCNGCGGNTCGLNFASNLSPGDGLYQMQPPAAGPSGALATSFAMTLLPQGGQVDDTDCPSLTLDSQGNRGPNPDCW